MAVSRPLMAFAFVRSWQRSLRSSHVVLPAPIEVPQHEMQGQLFDQRGADETADAGYDDGVLSHRMALPRPG